MSSSAGTGFLPLLQHAHRHYAEDDVAPKADVGERFEELARSIRWMVFLRWLAVSGVSVALLAGWWTGWSQHLIAPGLAVVGLAAFNLVVWLPWRSPGHTNAHRIEAMLSLQFYVDLLALALLVLWTGGIHNPFVLFGVFPIALASMLLPTRGALEVGGFAVALYGGLLACDQFSDLSSRPFGLDESRLAQQPLFIAAVLVATASTSFGVIYFVHTVARQRRRAEEERERHERIARTRQRLARVGKLSAGVAHSIRNPLHGVFNCLDLLRDEDDDGQRQQLLGLAKEGLQRIEGVSARLLTMTRERPLVCQAVDVNEQIQETLRLFELRLQPRLVDLRTEFGSIPAIRLDPLRFQEALFNLLDNALDAVASVDERWIRVSTRSIADPFDGVEIAIADSGIGIREELVGSVFDPFFTTKPPDQGTGLGLAVTREIVEEHGGVIEFASRPGKGTTVRMFLPLGEGEGPQAMEDGR